MPLLPSDPFHASNFVDPTDSGLLPGQSTVRGLPTNIERAAMALPDQDPTINLAAARAAFQRSNDAIRVLRENRARASETRELRRAFNAEAKRVLTLHAEHRTALVRATFAMNGDR
jgi:hypothetical protein